MIHLLQEKHNALINNYINILNNTISSNCNGIVNSKLTKTFLFFQVLFFFI